MERYTCCFLFLVGHFAGEMAQLGQTRDRDEEQRGPAPSGTGGADRQEGRIAQPASDDVPRTIQRKGGLDLLVFA